MFSQNNQQDAGEIPQKSIALKPPGQWYRLHSAEGESQPSPFIMLFTISGSFSLQEVIDGWIYVLFCIGWAAVAQDEKLTSRSLYSVGTLNNTNKFHIKIVAQILR